MVSISSELDVRVKVEDRHTIVHNLLDRAAAELLQKLTLPDTTEVVAFIGEY